MLTEIENSQFTLLYELPTPFLFQVFLALVSSSERSCGQRSGSQPASLRCSMDWASRPRSAWCCWHRCQ